MILEQVRKFQVPLASQSASESQDAQADTRRSHGQNASGGNTGKSSDSESAGSESGSDSNAQAEATVGDRRSRHRTFYLSDGDVRSMDADSDSLESGSASASATASDSDSRSDSESSSSRSDSQSNSDSDSDSCSKSQSESQQSDAAENDASVAQTSSRTGAAKQFPCLLPNASNPSNFQTKLESVSSDTDISLFLESLGRTSRRSPLAPGSVEVSGAAARQRGAPNKRVLLRLGRHPSDRLPEGGSYTESGLRKQIRNPKSFWNSPSCCTAQKVLYVALVC